MNYWLLKTEPEEYSWDDLVSEKEGTWDGVRSYAARNNLKAMKKKDVAFFYHTGKEKAIVGMCVISRESFSDPTSKEPGWVAVNVKAKKKFSKPVSLEEIKKDPVLKNMAIVRRGRLSVAPVTKQEANIIEKLGASRI